MPFYDYRCKPCDHVFTVRATMKDKEAGLQPECPVCHQKETRQLIAAATLIGRATVSQSRSAQGCNPLAGPGCCG